MTGVAARHGLVYRASLDFEPGAFPGYEHYRTLPHESLWGDGDGDAGIGDGGETGARTRDEWRRTRTTSRRAPRRWCSRWTTRRRVLRTGRS